MKLSSDEHSLHLLIGDELVEDRLGPDELGDLEGMHRIFIVSYFKTIIATSD